MTKKKMYYILIFGYILFILLCFPSRVKADSLNFSVQPIFSENQIEDSSFFNLQVAPEKSYTLEVLISNTSEEEVHIETKFLQTSTANDGSITYIDAKENKNKNLPFKFEEISKKPKVLTLAAGESSVLPIQITMPKKKFSGIYLAGLCFQNLDNKQKSDQKNKQVVMENEYNYIVAVQLQEDKEDDVALEIENIIMGRKLEEEGMTLPVVNASGSLKTNVTYHAIVYKNKEKEPWYEILIPNQNITPYSRFQLFIPILEKEITKGTYRVTLTLNDSDNKELWFGEKEFKYQLTKKQKPLLQSNQHLKKKQIFWYYLLFALLLLIVILFIKRNHDNKKAAIIRYKKSLEKMSGDIHPDKKPE